MNSALCSIRSACRPLSRNLLVRTLPMFTSQVGMAASGIRVLANVWTGKVELVSRSCTCPVTNVGDKASF